MYLIVGLGNPGTDYKKTRHNMGFMALDYIATKMNLNFNREKFGGIYTETFFQNEKVILLKPQKYINLSGEVIKKYLDFFKIPIENLLVISDDLDQPFGKLKIKYKGSSGGHNGLKNIELHLKTQNYHRIKLGISNNKLMDTKDYVLGKIPLAQEKELQQIMETVYSIFQDYFRLSFENLMNKYNHK